MNKWSSESIPNTKNTMVFTHPDGFSIIARKVENSDSILLRPLTFCCGDFLKRVVDASDGVMACENCERIYPIRFKTISGGWFLVESIFQLERWFAIKLEDPFLPLLRVQEFYKAVENAFFVRDLDRAVV